MKKRNLIYLGIFILLLVFDIYLLLRNTEVPENEDYVVLYQQLIDRIMESSDSLNSNNKYLAFDLDSFTLLEEGSEMTILTYATKYNNNVIHENMNSLTEKGYFVEGMLEGLLISSEVIKENKYGNSIRIEISKYKGPLAMYGIKYKATFKDGKWQLKELENFIS